MTRATSVLMAEPTAIALAAIVTDRLHLQQINSLSDDLLVHFLNAETKQTHQIEGSYTLLKCSLTTQGKEIEEFSRFKDPRTVQPTI
jgi:predicted small secreted protein